MKLTIAILEFLVKRKKILGVFNSNFKTYTRYTGFADEDKKKVFVVFNGKFLSILLGAIIF